MSIRAAILIFYAFWFVGSRGWFLYETGRSGKVWEEFVQHDLDWDDQWVFFVPGLFEALLIVASTITGTFLGIRWIANQTIGRLFRAVMDAGRRRRPSEES